MFHSFPPHVLRSLFRFTSLPSLPVAHHPPLPRLIRGPGRSAGDWLELESDDPIPREVAAGRTVKVRPLRRWEIDGEVTLVAHEQPMFGLVDNQVRRRLEGGREKHSADRMNGQVMFMRGLRYCFYPL